MGSPPRSHLATAVGSVTAPQPVPLSHVPVVSLVMTVYNTEAFLAEAIESVLAQTFTNWELIIWDDGSTDGSVAIGRAYAEREPRIHFQAGSHVGRGKSQHQAHQLVRGTYVGWLDADDRLAPTALEETVIFLDDHPDYGMVYTNYIDMDVTGKELGVGYRCQIPYVPNRLLIDLLTFHFRLIRTSVFHAVGGVNTEMRVATDYDLCLRIEEISRIYHLERPLYYYRLNPNGISYTKRDLQRQASQGAVNQALARRGLAHTYEVVWDEKKKRCWLQPRPTVPIAEVAKSQFEAGKGFAQRGNLDGAVVCFEAAIRLQPQYVAAYNQLGNTWQQLGQLDRAIAAYQEILAINPKVAQAYCNLGAIWQLQGKMEDAIAAYQRAIALKPNFAIAHHNLAKAYGALAQWDLALHHYQATVQLDPHQIDAHLHLGQLAMDRGRLDLAQTALQQVLAHNPHHADALFSLGQLHEAQDNPDAALTCYQTLEAHCPDWATVAAYHLSQARRHLCDWQHYDDRRSDLLDRLTTHVRQPEQLPVAPLNLSLFSVPPDLHRAVSQHYASYVQRNMATVQGRCIFTHPTGAIDRLRIGYLSPDFRHHAVGMLVQEMFPHHDRTRFQVYAYSLMDVADEVQARIKAGCDEFVDLSQMTTEAAARRIHADGIHILIDLAGYTTYSRPGILALRPSPIQCSYLGFPDTTGAPWIDYLLTDEWVVPPELAVHYSEKVVYLPHQFVVSPTFAGRSTPARPVYMGRRQYAPGHEVERSRLRAQHGLPTDAMVFCCFNVHRKIDPTVFALWMRILQQVPHALLWLSDGAATTKANLRATAQALGVEGDRLIFAPRLPFNQYLARYRCADLFLDTFTYNAGSTAVCALAAGVPLLTRPGHNNASRMGASLCAAAGLEVLICDSNAAYEQTAVHLATHPDELRALRQRLQDQPHTLPLFQPQRWIRDLESTYWRLWGNQGLG